MRLSYILSFFILATSSSAIAGGGGNNSWQPSVSPEFCVVVSGPLSGPFVWYRDSGCAEVIQTGYAKGVRYSGVFYYTDGTKLGFNTIILPNSSIQFHHKGKIVESIENITASWSK
ncbi:hypothetical protein ZS55_004494 [Salmonella enterica subsp. salamae]|nr:hypothetical protein [Salmonella enterica subsp. salamae]